MKSTYILLSILLLVNWSCKDTPSDPPIIEDDTEELVPTTPEDRLIKCDRGLINDYYPCEGIDLVSYVYPGKMNVSNSIDGVKFNDLWGWTDPDTGTEYALVGLVDGVAFVDLSDPYDPVYVGRLAESKLKNFKMTNDPDFETCMIGIGTNKQKTTGMEGTIWRDIKVYNNHMYVVSDAQAHGMQVFDLTRLRTFDDEPINFTEDAVYKNIANAHNIVINESSGFAYAVGATNTTGTNGEGDCNSGGLHMIDIRDPENPTFAGCYDDTSAPRRYENSAYIHDAQCVIYTGPDADHNGREICFNAAERSMIITDVTDKDSVITLGFGSHPNVQYSHQGWLTEDQKYFIMNDELDEYNLGRNTRTHIFDVSDLDNPFFIDSFIHATESIDHNLYVKGNIVYMSNYNSGLRMFSLSDLGNAQLSPLGYFDSKPDGETQEEAGFYGSWSNYPFFESGIILITDIEKGLYILKPDFPQ